MWGRIAAAAAFLQIITPSGFAQAPPAAPQGAAENLGFAPGFYRVKSSQVCQTNYGSVVFAFWNRPQPKLDYRELLARGTKGEYKVFLKSIQTGDWVIGDPKHDCSLTFEASNFQPLGVCSEFQAHRGDVRIYPANSIKAFQHALEEGFGGFELDIQLSSDGVAVVSHDNRLGPATNCKGRINKKTWAEIKDCRMTHSPLLPEAGIFGKKAQVETSISSLQEVFADFSKDSRVRRIHIDVKPKHKPEELVKAIQDSLPKDPKEREALESRLSIIAKEFEDLNALRTAFPKAHIAFESDMTISGILDRSKKNYWGPQNCHYDTLSVAFGTIFNPLLQIAKVLRGEGTGDGANFRRLYRRNLRQAEDGKRLLGWTLNAKSGIKKLRRFHLDDILTDVPMQKLAEILFEGTHESEILANMDDIRKNGAIEACREAAAIRLPKPPLPEDFELFVSEGIPE